MKREDAEKIYDLGKDAVVDLILHLVDRIEKLEGQLKKNSHNSSKPPSSDGLKKKKRTRSQRKPSGKKSGGQKGHEGKTLEQSDNPDEIISLSVDICSHCEGLLGNCTPKNHDRRQVFDIPQISVHITEYQAEIKDCPHCGAENKADFPEDVTHKVQYGNYLKGVATYFRNYQLVPIERSKEIFEDLFSIPLCEGTLVNITKKCAESLNGFYDWVIEKLKHSGVVNFDETGVNIGGKLHWLHNASTPLLTSYFVHQKRGSDACDALGILPVFKGTAVHDHWSSYFKYDCNHSLCNSHHLRELMFVYEHYEQKWAQKMISFLCELKYEVEKAGSERKLLENHRMKYYENRYKRILREGFYTNPPPEPDEKKKRGRKKKGKVLCLLERLRDHRKEVLAFMYDLDVPFDNNLAERDVRMIKVQQKVSGLFRTFSGAEQFCIIRSFISTVKKQGFCVLDALGKIFNGEKVYLEFNC
ncbi:MAG: IS66 family transposase [Kosmotogaceae bacterium]